MILLNSAMEIRKSHIEIGNIYFWTATINKWHRLLKDDLFKEVIIQSLAHLTRLGKIDVFAFVIMPNHIHIIWRMNEKNGKEMAHSSFLKYTAHEFKKIMEMGFGNLGLSDFAVDANNKAYEYWQRDSLAIYLYSRDVAFQKLDYIHLNPLAEHWQLANDPVDYKYSTARFYEQGIKEYGFIKDLREEF